MFTNEQTFFDYILETIFRDMHVIQDRNVDPFKFEDSLSKFFFVKTSVTNLKIFINNYVNFYGAYNLLCDQESKSLFIDLVRYRIAGYLHIKLPTNTEEYWDLRNKYYVNDKSANGRIEVISGNVMLNSQKIFVHTFQGPFFALFVMRQYLFNRGSVKIMPEEGDYVIDCGAFLGETALAFSTFVGELGRVYAFEILESHLNIIKLNIDNNNLAKIIKIFPYAVANVHQEGESVSSQDACISFSLNGAEFKHKIACRRLDDLVGSENIPRVDYLKMDIEGAELDALQGAEMTLRRFRPKLAISLYHNFEDYFSIPNYLASLNLGYQFYIDHYTIYEDETVLYAIAR